VVAAGSVVLEKEKPPPKVLLASVPAKPVRDLDTSDVAAIKRAAEAYVELVKFYGEKP
jgi:carbonic anhydrase/acetyltransferase-like protein (isoleucine patch superfamily)